MPQRMELLIRLQARALAKNFDSTAWNSCETSPAATYFIALKYEGGEVL